MRSFEKAINLLAPTLPDGARHSILLDVIQ